MRFAIPREPRLTISMLAGSRRPGKLPAPFDERPTHWFFWARNAIYHGLSALGVEPGTEVLVPAYHCATAIEPVVRRGTRAVFYNVRRDGSPDLDDIRSRITGETRALLVVHYFGFAQPLAELRDLCARHGLQLIEDCAHILHAESGEGTLGTLGDVSVFSWRKFLPLYDGGQLVINRPGIEARVPWREPSGGARLRAAKNVVDRLIDDSTRPWMTAVGRLRGLVYGLAAGALARQRAEARASGADTRSLSFDPRAADLPMSGWSRRVVERVDLARVAARRRHNYARLYRAVASIDGVEPFRAGLEGEAIPWVFPLVARGRRSLHVALRERGIPAFTWDGVIHPSLPLDRFPDADFLYHEVVLLPVHQDVDDSATDLMLETLEGALRAGGGP